MKPVFLKDLREYLDALRTIGEVADVGIEVDWNLEMGAIIRRCYDLGAPAPLFNRIAGIDSGFRAFGAPAGTSRQPGLYLCRVALSLGLPARATGQEIVEALVAARKSRPVPPRRIPTGPCKENILTGDQVDLLRLPTPLLHAGDGGRYINTWHKYHPNAPFCGYKMSGYGREQGAEALESYSQHKSVWANIA